MILVPAAVPTDMTTCDLCGNLVTKSNLTLHQLRCSTNVVSAATHNPSRRLQNSTRPKSTNNHVNRQESSAKQKKKKKEKWEKISHIVKKYLFVFTMSCSSMLDYMWVHIRMIAAVQASISIHPTSYKMKTITSVHLHYLPIYKDSAWANLQSMLSCVDWLIFAL